ncbi:MAG: 50S ribosomal protein L7Ae [Candidatus Aenigmatarchaeota archaeon]
MPAFVKFQTPADLQNVIHEAIATATQTGKLRKGVNETTKCIERGLAKLVVMAEDVTPEEILMHIPIICEEKQVPYAYVPSKEELGRYAGLSVPTASIAIENEGDGKRLIDEIKSKLSEVKK